MRHLRFWTICLLLSVTLLLVHLRGDTDRTPASTPLAQFPTRVGGLIGTDIPISLDSLAILGNGIFLSRLYQPDSLAVTANPDRNALSLFIGYFPTQRSGQSIHSPQNCLPGAGWTFESKGVTEIPAGNQRRYRVGEYLISNGTYKQEVLYWYQSHGKSIANDYLAKLYMMRDAILYDRTDAALVRIITSLQPGETQQDAHRRAVAFAKKITPLLPTYIPD
jgi:EpsI family protein